MSHPYALPLEQNPPIQSYQDHAFWLSILLGNDPQLLPWLTMQYTNLIWKKDNQVLSPYIYSKWRFGTEEILPMEHFFNVSPSLFSRPSFDIVAIVKDMLDQGLYQLGSFDEYYMGFFECHEDFKRMNHLQFEHRFNTVHFLIPAFMRWFYRLKKNFKRRTAIPGGSSL